MAKVQTLTITGDTGFFTVESSSTQKRTFPKNGLILRREGDKFFFENGGDEMRSILDLNYGTDTITVDAVAPESADALEIALIGVLFQ